MAYQMGVARPDYEAFNEGGGRASGPAEAGIVPVAPVTVAETGVGLNELMNLTAKTLQSLGIATASTLASHLKLTYRVAALVVEQMQMRQIVEAQGAEQLAASAELRYALTEKGKAVAWQAQATSRYLGPAPISLNRWIEQIDKQRITGERVTAEMVSNATNGLVVSDEFLTKIGPAANSGRTILLYGPAGNGKTSVSEKIGAMFESVVYIPHAVEIDGQYIKVFDPSLHEPVDVPEQPRSSVRSSVMDGRFVACRRPFVVVGGELTLAMLDMQFDPLSKTYEAPRHLKALNGVFLVDDFGRQQVTPEQMLNRWIVPLESRREYLRLTSGKNVCVPFDELVIFSTNLDPAALMDPAFLRRIPYKLEIPTPTEAEFRLIFKRVAAAKGFADAPETLLRHAIKRLKSRGDGILACFQPAFLLSQVVDHCSYLGQAPVLSAEALDFALDNLFVDVAAG